MYVQLKTELAMVAHSVVNTHPKRFRPPSFDCAKHFVNTLCLSLAVDVESRHVVDVDPGRFPIYSLLYISRNITDRTKLQTNPSTHR